MKNLSRIIVSLFLVLLAGSCNGIHHRVRLSGETVTETRTVGSFDAISVSSGIDLLLIQGNEQKVVVKADREVIGNVKTEVSGNTLKIFCEHSFWRFGNISVEATFTALKEVHASSGSDVKTSGTLNLDQIELSLSSGSDLHFNANAKTVELTASSGSDATLSGNSGMVSIRASSGSDIHAQDLIADDVTVKGSSGSDIQVTAKRSLDAEATGGSDIYVKGKPEKQNVNTSGGSDVYFQ